MRGRQVIDATRLNGSITAGPGGLLVEGRRVALEDVAVLLIGNDVSISGGALTKLIQYDVIMLNCDWRAVPNMVGLGWSDNSRVGARHRAQAEMSQPRRKSAWQAIVKAKIYGQQRNLEFASQLSAARRLTVLRKEVRSGDPSNCEAQAARLYWDSYFADESFRRLPGAEDRINSLLNYGYAVLRGFVTQAVTAAGLWPSYGLWHRNRGNAFALVDDVIEPFRPAVDHRVLALGSVATLDERHVKQQLVGVTSAPMNRRGPTVASAIYDFTSSLALYIERESDVLDVPTWFPVPEAESDAGRLESSEGEDG